jgi:hypothetical protein
VLEACVWMCECKGCAFWMVVTCGLVVGTARVEGERLEEKRMRLKEGVGGAEQQQQASSREAKPQPSPVQPRPSRRAHPLLAGLG